MAAILFCQAISYDLVVETKMYFSAEPMESRTYLDNQYFIILSLST